MTIKSRLILVIIAFLLNSLLLNSCNKESEILVEISLLILSTKEAIEITQTTAKCGGNIISDMGVQILNMAFVTALINHQQLNKIRLKMIMNLKVLLFQLQAYYQILTIMYAPLTHKKI